MTKWCDTNHHHVVPEVPTASKDSGRCRGAARRTSRTSLAGARVFTLVKPSKMGGGRRGSKLRVYDSKRS